MNNMKKSDKIDFENNFSEKDAIELLKMYSTSEKTFELVLSHSQAVKKLAIKISKKVKPTYKIDLHIIKIGSILHDIGRFKYPPGKNSIFHGIEGEKILKSHNLIKCANIAKTHIGIGISKKEVEEQNLPIPKNNYIPKSIEELIICYSDNRIAGTKVMPEKWVEDRFEKEIGQKYKKKTINFHKKMHEILIE
jgi:uncharacterized protein